MLALIRQPEVGWGSPQAGGAGLGGVGLLLLFLASGVLGLVGIRDPRRAVACADCAGGQLAGQPVDAARPRRSADVEPALTAE